MDSGVEKLAWLSRIAMSQEELARMGKDMESIMNLMDSIKTADLMQEQDLGEPDSLSMLRADLRGSSLALDEISFVHGSSQHPAFRIPRVIE
ncbi:MAG: aspartyl/glutamyl-tRNA amidotransferase subunit C [Clostridiales bacterium]|jgi:aspartyl/glutamyl-tRNA(Asn/Gln) amidotransferase C subunit|nr:aspartyl/glutamyl-tRNA amidotransferase subunit C [Clostridiales bacterium]MDR2751069.1 aspartyl/glutamyl-tRNA amidotransferase subunit C [Clostridiales bacterium]